ncbi:MAG: hypothetical protein C6H99_03700 [Epsilonproteobacteria bacterium]|nr:hypothetical protein [Campylobacterota bacterium]NPA63384.1 hypothetical protein [Campylobacterota bacterium]
MIRLHCQKSNLIRWFLVAALLLSFAFGDEDDYEEEHMPKDLSFLHLSPSQQLQFKELLSHYFDRLHTIHEKEEKLEKWLEKNFVKENFDKAEYLKRSVELKKEKVRIEADFLADLHKLLSPKQREKFARYIEEWEDE